MSGDEEESIQELGPDDGHILRQIRHTPFRKGASMRPRCATEHVFGFTPLRDGVGPWSPLRRRVDFWNPPPQAPTCNASPLSGRPSRLADSPDGVGGQRHGWSAWVREQGASPSGAPAIRA